MIALVRMRALYDDVVSLVLSGDPCLMLSLFLLLAFFACLRKGI